MFQLVIYDWWFIYGRFRKNQLLKAKNDFNVDYLLTWCRLMGNEVWWLWTVKNQFIFFGELCGCWPNRTLSFRSGRTARRRRPGRASGSRQERHAHQLAAAAHSPTRRRQRQRRCAPSPLAFHRCSRIRLYHPRIHHPAAYIGHFRLEPNFYMIKPSGCIIQPSGYIGHFERCEREHLRA